METNKNYADVLGKTDGDTLAIFCVDSLIMKDKTTFYALSADGVQLTYWFDDEIDNKEERVNLTYDLLFDELTRMEMDDPQSELKFLEKFIN